MLATSGQKPDAGNTAALLVYQFSHLMEGHCDIITFFVSQRTPGKGGGTLSLASNRNFAAPKLKNIQMYTILWDSEI